MAIGQRWQWHGVDRTMIDGTVAREVISVSSLCAGSETLEKQIECLVLASIGSIIRDEGEGPVA
jgi:hypothetical protein